MKTSQTHFSLTRMSITNRLSFGFPLWRNQLNFHHHDVLRLRRYALMKKLLLTAVTTNIVIFVRLAYKCHISYGYSSQTMRSVLCLLDTRFRLSFGSVLLHPLEWNLRIHCEKLLNLRTAPLHPSHINIKILIHVWFGALCVQIWLRIVSNLAVDVLFGTSFINRFFRQVFSSEPKVVHWSPHSVASWFHSRISSHQFQLPLVSARPLTTITRMTWKSMKR